MTATVCRLRGAPLAGPYCHACGQDSAALPRTWREALTGQTGKLLHTLRALALEPGELAREIDERRDRRSLRPLTLLLNLIAVFFIFGGGPGGLTAESLVRMDSTGQLAAQVAAVRNERHVDPGVFAERLEQRFRSSYSLLILLSSIAYAFALWLVERRRRKPWLVNGAAAIHVLCFIFLLSAVVFGAMRAVGRAPYAGPWTGAITTLVVFGYLVLMPRRIYGDGYPFAVMKSVVVILIGSLSDDALGFVALAVAVFTA